MPRTRSRSESSGSITTTWSGSGVKTYWDPRYDYETGTAGPYDSTFTELSVHETMTDRVNPGFKKISSKGGIVLSPMSQSKTYVMNSSAPFNLTYTFITRVGSSRYWGHWDYSFTGNRASTEILNLDFPEVSDDLTESVRSRAISECFGNISLSEAQLWVTLGESKKTVSSIKKILRSVYRLLIKRDFSQLRKLRFDDLSDAWLSLRYELRPLYYECLGYAKALQATHPANMRQTFRGYVEDESSSVRDSSKHITYNILGHTRCTTTVRVRARAGVLTDVDFAGASHVLGVYELPQAAWELVPFSFIIDWFVNIGTVISSWSPKPGFKLLGSWVVVEKEVEKTAQFLGASVDETRNTFESEYTTCSLSSSACYSEKTITKSREINPSRPILPSFDVRLDTFKLLDLALILRNLAK